MKHSKLLAWVCLIMLGPTLFSPGRLFAQTETEEDCRTPISDEQYLRFLKETPAVKRLAAGAPSPLRQPTMVPVYFTVFRNSDGSYSDQEVDEALVGEALARLDSIFAPAGLRFIQCGSINYVDHDGLSTFNAHRHLSELSYISTALNVYTRSGTGSFAQYPGVVDPNVNGANYGSPVESKNNLMSIDSDAFTYPTFPHEIGHSYGLLHTFEGAHIYNNPSEPTPGYTGGFKDHPYGEGGNVKRRELVIRAPDPEKDFGQPNAALSGDFVEDTPAFCKRVLSYFPDWANEACQEYPFNASACNRCLVVNCHYEGSYVDYNGDTLVNTDISVRNLMSYTGQCRSELTTGQFDRIAYYNETVRKLQYDHNLCVNLNDRVEFEDTGIGIDDVVIMLSHENTYRHCNALSNSQGAFQGVVYDEKVKARVTRVGSAPDPDYDNNPGDYSLPATEEVIDNSYLPLDWRMGLEVADLLPLYKHLQGLESLNGYQQIAADVSNDGMLSEIDLVLMARLILGEIDRFPAHRTPWRFIPEYLIQDHGGAFHNDPFNMTIGQLTFVNEAPYLNEDWEYEIGDGMSGNNGFHGIKLGDLDQSSIADLPAPAGLLPAPVCEESRVRLYQPGLFVAAGKELMLELFADEPGNIAAFQLGFQVDAGALEVLEVIPFEKQGFLTNVHEGALRILWAGGGSPSTELSQASPLLTIRLKAKRNIHDLSPAFRMEDRILKAGFLDHSGCSRKTQLEAVIKEDKSLPDHPQASSPLVHRLEKLNCFPNPSKGAVHIIFQSLTAGEGKLTIRDLHGRQIYQVALPYHEGFNEHFLDEPGIPAGLLLLTLDTGDTTYTQRIVKLQY